ncbi:hypothetical protein ACEWY4_019361 [Coilia grayii]|uniref:Uncharacterized protein n=1 Tax=Coilia grayii TaxID=363190 RepID=A0ABD1J9I3_9TELE
MLLLMSVWCVCVLFSLQRHIEGFTSNTRSMRFTFRSDDRMVITIPLGSLREIRAGQLMPDRFTCVFKDVYKVFLRGQPKALGVCQLVAGVFIISMGVLLSEGTAHPTHTTHTLHLNPLLYTMPSILFIISGMLSYAAGHTPHMGIMKLSFACNIVCTFWAIAAIVLCGNTNLAEHTPHVLALRVLVGVLLGGEMLVAIVMVYWESKAVCRDYFNILPTITLKQDT